MISLHFAEMPLMGCLMQGCDMLRYLFIFVQEGMPVLKVAFKPRLHIH